MIVGIGTDIIEVARIEKSMKSDAFKLRVFTEKEQKYCDAKKTFAVSYAARYAAKEAFFKALGTGWRGDLKFTDVEVLNDDLGKPFFELHGEALNRIKALNAMAHLSLSHISELAVAYVVIEK